MATKSSIPAPLTFDLEEPLVDKIEKCREHLGLDSTSEVVRLAISKFNYDRFKPATPPHRQISVRLTGDMRTMLKRTARSKSVSIGELLRVAIEELATNGRNSGAKKPAPKKGRR
jgi:Arc/MetJ-type ribon-helix-helix transcriptional regulator